MSFTGLNWPEPPDWKGSALCAQADPEAWFPKPGEDTELARAICRRCPVQPDCLEAGLGEKHGIWGGLTRYGRDVLKRQRRHQATHPDPDTETGTGAGGPIAA